MVMVGEVSQVGLTEKVTIGQMQMFEGRAWQVKLTQRR